VISSAATLVTFEISAGETCAADLGQVAVEVCRVA